MIAFFCLFYYIFSVLFMTGFVGSSVEDRVQNPKLWMVLFLWLMIMIFSPILFPVSLGNFIYKNQRDDSRII